MGMSNSPSSSQTANPPGPKASGSPLPPESHRPSTRPSRVTTSRSPGSSGLSPGRSIQIRPDRDGRYRGHRGLEAAFQRCGNAIYEYELPEAGTKTKGLDRGWLVNTWFRLKHENYDHVRELMTFLGETVRADAR